MRTFTRHVRRSLAENCGGDREGESRMAPSTLYSRHNPHIHPAHVNARLSREVSGTWVAAAATK